MSTPTSDVQLEGAMKFATVDAAGVPVAASLTDFSDVINKLVIGRKRASVARKPTYGDARNIQRAGALEEQVTIEFLGEEGVAAGFHRMAWTALKTAPCILYFQAVYKSGAVSATNPMYTGYITLTAVDAGAPAGESKYQAQTWPAFGVSDPLSTAPTLV